MENVSECVEVVDGIFCPIPLYEDFANVCSGHKSHLCIREHFEHRPTSLGMGSMRALQVIHDLYASSRGTAMMTGLTMLRV